MTDNEFEDSRISESSMKQGAQHPGSGTDDHAAKPREESKAVSRDDERDGVIPPGESERVDKEHRGRAGLPL